MDNTKLHTTIHATTIHDIPPHATRTVLLTGDDPEDKRQQLKLAFTHTWALYESLFDIITQDEATTSKPSPFVTP